MFGQMFNQIRALLQQHQAQQVPGPTPQFPSGPVPQGSFAPMPFEGGIPNWGNKGGMWAPAMPQVPGFQNNPMQMGGSLQDMLRSIMGRVSGSAGARGPDRNPFAGLARFAGPFGNGGGPLLPTMGQGGFGRMRL